MQLNIHHHRYYRSNFRQSVPSRSLESVKRFTCRFPMRGCVIRTSEPHKALLSPPFAKRVRKAAVSPLYPTSLCPTGQLAKGVNTFAILAKIGQENHTFPEDLRTLTITPWCSAFSWNYSRTCHLWPKRTKKASTADCYFVTHASRQRPTLPPDVTSESRDVNKHAGGDNDLWTGSDVICIQTWRTTLPQAVT